MVGDNVVRGMVPATYSGKTKDVTNTGTVSTWTTQLREPYEWEEFKERGEIVGGMMTFVMTTIILFMVLIG